MPDSLPVHLKPLQLAEQGASLAGRVGLAGMPRLIKSLVRHDRNEVQVALAFGYRSDGTAAVSGTLQTRLVMQCQRCLGEVGVDIDRAFELLLMPAAQARAGQPAASGPEVYELAGERILSRDLIEDELLLALPQAPRHPHPAACDADTAGHLQPEFDARTGRDKHNPFAVLKDLK